MELAYHFHLTPRDVDDLYEDEFRAFVASVREIRKAERKK